MALIKIQNKFQVTLPKAVRESLGLKIGDYVEIDKSGDEISLRPVSTIPKDQRYFYTPEWQKMEAEADKSIEKGDLVGPFDNAQDLLASLKE